MDQNSYAGHPGFMPFTKANVKINKDNKADSNSKDKKSEK